MSTIDKPSRGLGILYAVVIFLSAFLLFQVQPLIGKCILPWFGGTPAVWTTCMLVFQLLLFAGYAYAHLTTKYLSPRGQAWLHVALLVTALCTLPITPDASWKPEAGQSPALRIVLLLTATIGLPYFVLSSTSPLIQGWFSRTHSGQTPYRLYSLSNVGSLLALLSYPFLVEPTLATESQSHVWSVLFFVFGLLCALGALRMVAVVPRQSQTRTAAIEADGTAPSWGLTGLWFGLSMTASILLLAITNQVCMDVAVVPFLWVLPLALYLVTFILCFDSERWYSRRRYSLISALLLFGSILMIGRGSMVPIALQIVVFFGMMFCCCMVCHGELAALKPHPRYLTAYFLTMSAGGAAGGLFVALLAPVLFVAYNELYFGIFTLLFLFVLLLLREDNARWPYPSWTGPLAIAGIVFVVLGLLSQVGRNEESALEVKRNFYGVLRVRTQVVDDTQEPLLQLAHGRIAHGSQFIAEQKRHIPTAYYAHNTGIGQVMKQLDNSAPQHIGVVGLGIGTLAAYGRAGDRVRMYEINPQVIELARKHFTFLRDCAAEQTIVTGDARLSLEFEPAQQFDVLVLDAFSGDAIPVHLLTQQALDVYLKHMKSDGILAYHISNLHFDLQPVILGLANSRDLTVKFQRNDADSETAALASIWALVSPSAERLARIDQAEKTQLVQARAIKAGSAKSQSVKAQRPVGRPILWTDNRNNLLEVLW